MHVEKFSLGPLGTNCYVIEQEKACLIIDPGGNPEIIDQYIEQNRLTVQAILLTHAHFDHIGAVDEIRTKYNVPVYVHREEKDWLQDPDLNRSILFMGEAGAISTKAPEHILDEGELTIGSFHFEVIHTPGHSPGSVTFIFHPEQFIMSGDVLFHQGVGRTDLPGGSLEVLAHSITQKLYKLPDYFVVHPGHGTDTTIGEEKNNNPYTLQFYRQ